MDFDPITGKLWLSENGLQTNDEINLIESGFNGGWKDLTGFAPPGFNYSGLVSFNGTGKYNDPKFVWNQTVAPTALLFFIVVIDSDPVIRMIHLLEIMHSVESIILSGIRKELD